jgi:hypothetical protein
MSTEMGTELREAFHAMSDAIVPPADLTDRVRRAARRRSRTVGLTSLLVAATVLAAGAAYLADAAGIAGTASHQPRPQRSISHRVPGPARARLIVPLPQGEGIEAMAVAGQYLYLAMTYSGTPPYTLAVYDRLNGRLIRQVSVPAEPAALRTGPAGSVWLTFYADQDGGPSGVWLFNADLIRRSELSGFGPVDLLPTSADTALAANQTYLMLVRMPPPGTQGKATAHYDKAATINSQWAVNALAPLADRIAAQVTNGYGYHSQVLIAGQPRLRYGGGPSQQIGSIAAQDNGLWAVAASNGNPNVGELIRLSPDLRLITPAAVSTNAILRQSEQVWSSGGTVWVATASAKHPLVCFGYNGQMGAIATITYYGSPVALAVEGNTVYVTLAGNEAYETSGVLAYPIPAPCQS